MDFRVFSVLRFTDGMQLSELQDVSASEALEPNMKREPWRATILGQIRGGHFLIFFSSSQYWAEVAWYIWANQKNKLD